MKRLSSVCVLAFALMLASRGHAQTSQSLETIQRAAESFVRAQLPPTQGKHHINANRLDSRLRLANCTNPLEAFVANNGVVQTRTTVGVRCRSAAAWTVYVPVNVETEMPVLVLRRALAGRSAIGALDVELQTRRVPGLSADYVSDPAQLNGRRLRRALAVGALLTNDALERTVLVQRGQRVTLLATSGGLEIRAQGQALSDGAARERVRVQNVNSLKVVEGVVESAGVVRVDL